MKRRKNSLKSRYISYNKRGALRFICFCRRGGKCKRLQKINPFVISIISHASFSDNLFECVGTVITVTNMMYNI